MQKDKLITDQNSVCNHFNNFFVKVAKDIGKERETSSYKDHPGISSTILEVKL